MAFFKDIGLASASREQIGINQGLRSYMVQVYTYMCLGLGLTGSVALFIASVPSLALLFLHSPLGLVVMLATLGIALSFGAALTRVSLATARMLFWTYAVLMGISCSSIFLIYQGESIARVFLIAGSTFGIMSLYGYTTKRDLSSWGSFLTMGVIGLVVASLFNVLLAAFGFSCSGFQIFLSFVSVLLFTGLTAYDVQSIRDFYDATMPGEILERRAILGALQLYLDAINIFLSLLRLMGDRR